jgi:membrane protein YdbS with pleckstrin-like domain
MVGGVTVCAKARYPVAGMEQGLEAGGYTVSGNAAKSSRGGRQLPADRDGLCLAIGAGRRQRPGSNHQPPTTKEASMSYIEESLSNGEEVYQIFQHHWMVKAAIALHFILALITVGLWLIPAILVWLSWKKMEQGVTNKRVIHKHGIIARKTDEMRLKSIEAIFINQGIMGRIFGFGTVTVTGRGQGDVKLRWMADPMQVKKAIENAEHESANLAAA